ncbi:MAG: class II aldolase/adducin family protein, partial [Burkholderiaceae bacterium]
KDLADRVVEALEGRMACLMANHGLVCCGKELEHAIFLSEELEALCKQYLTARSIGGVKILSDSEMELVIEKFKNYGYATEK